MALLQMHARTELAIVDFGDKRPYLARVQKSYNLSIFSTGFVNMMLLSRLAYLWGRF